MDTDINRIWSNVAVLFVYFIDALLCGICL